MTRASPGHGALCRIRQMGWLRSQTTPPMGSSQKSPIGWAILLPIVPLLGAVLSLAKLVLFI